MMTSSRPHDNITGTVTGRLGHSSQLSISDPSHHVTEAIGTLYGDEDDSAFEGNRPLSFVGGPSYQEQLQRPRHQLQQSPQPSEHRRQSTRSPPKHIQDLSNCVSEDTSLRKLQTMPPLASCQSNNSIDPVSSLPSSPTLSLRGVQVDTSKSSFPLASINYPNDIAQELSNLQALRRLSMDVGNNIDPDMPLMNLSAMPVIAPSGDDDENDPSRLLWVPARVHPELAPSEFKSFLENRVQSIRRRSGDFYLSFYDHIDHSEPGLLATSSLRRKKSMLSRQIDDSEGRGTVDYIDGAESLERKRLHANTPGPEFSLDELFKDPSKAVQKLAQESQGHLGTLMDNSVDMPILPMAPGIGLRRSTRTTYRKGGSLRYGDKAPFPKRVVQHHQETSPYGLGLSPTLDIHQGQATPRMQPETVTENFSRPTRSVRRQQKFSQDSSATPDDRNDHVKNPADSLAVTPEFLDSLTIRGSSNTAITPVVEISSPEDTTKSSQDEHQPRAFSHMFLSQIEEPRRDSLADVPASEPSGSSARHPGATSGFQPVQGYYPSISLSTGQTRTMNDILTSTPSPNSDGGASRTDNLALIPTFVQDDRKVERKTKKDRDEESSGNSVKSGSAWKWFKGVAEDKEKKKDENKRSKAKSQSEKAQDNVRLDVIQTSIDKTAAKSRESLVLDRDSVDSKLQEERKKESHRKFDSKKEKEGNIFTSIFGGSKKREEKERNKRGSHSLQVPEDPPYKPLQPDIDYYWSRFPLLEERAIYRMAHIKLANPRRSLLSQVLLSNFMYSYLAIVQAMHPQMNVPVSPQQKRLEEEARRKRQEEDYLAQRESGEQQDGQQSLDQYSFDYHRMTVDYEDSGSEGQVEYVDDAQIYEDEHGADHHPTYEDNSDGYGQDSKDYFQYRTEVEERHDDNRDGMW